MFGKVGGIAERAAVAAHGESVDFEPLVLKRRDFPPDEAVRGARVGIDQITDSQADGP
jgi:hypothetical protein